MKSKKIIDLCKKAHYFNVSYDEANDTQWLSDGHAIYPLLNVPYLTEEYICKLYDITDKQKEKIAFVFHDEMPNVLNLGDADITDSPAEKLDISIIVDGGGVLIPYKTEEGLLFLQAKYLTPFTDVQESEINICTRKTKSGSTVFIIKLGLIAYACVAPYEIHEESFVDKLGTLYRMSQMAFENKKRNNNE